MEISGTNRSGDSSEDQLRHNVVCKRVPNNFSFETRYHVTPITKNHARPIPRYRPAKKIISEDQAARGGVRRRSAVTTNVSNTRRPNAQPRLESSSPLTPATDALHVRANGTNRVDTKGGTYATHGDIPTFRLTVRLAPNNEIITSKNTYTQKYVCAC